MQLLDLLDHSPAGSAQMGDLAKALASLPSRVTRQVRRLEGHGLVLREVSPRDRRRVMVIITAAGRTVAEQAMITYAHVVRTHFLDPLSRAQIAAMADTCDQIGTTLKSFAQPVNSGSATWSR